MAVWVAVSSWEMKGDDDAERRGGCPVGDVSNAMRVDAWCDASEPAMICDGAFSMHSCVEEVGSGVIENAVEVLSRLRHPGRPCLMKREVI